MEDNLAKEDGLGYFNLARGIGILIILFGHSLTIFMVESKEADLLFSGWGTVFGGGILSAFFMISGYGFYKRSPKKCFSIQKKILLYPYWMVTSAILITKCVLAGVKQRPFREHGGELVLTYLFGLNAEGGKEIHGLSIESVGVLWFVFTLFVAWNIYNMIVQMKSKQMQNVLVIGCVILGYLLTLVSKIWPFCIPMALIVVGYIALGHRIRENHLLTKKIPVWSWMIMFATILVSVTFGDVNMVACIWKLGLIDITATFCIGFLLLRLYAYAMRREWNGTLVRMLEELGFKSIWLICIHAYEKIIFPWYRIPRIFADHILVGIVLSIVGRIVILYILYQVCSFISKVRKKKKKQRRRKMILED